VPEDATALPDFVTWPTFPFEGNLRIKRLETPVTEEPPRQGDDPDTCLACQAPDSAYIWVSDRWRVRALDRPTGLPMVLILESRSHLDLGDLPNLLAAELGVMTVRLERAVRSLDGVARVHVNRWGDGSAHLHLWFLARPFGRLQLRGTFLSLWDDILPAIAEERWRENLALVAAWLAEFGGRPLAEPPRIDWKAPSRLDGTQEPALDLAVDPDSIADFSGEAEPHAEQEGTAEAAAGTMGEGATADPGPVKSEPATAQPPTETPAPPVAEPKDAGPSSARPTAEASATPTSAGDQEPDATVATAAGESTQEAAVATPARVPAGRPEPDPLDPEEAWEEGV
jgi:hypothetical protein